MSDLTPMLFFLERAMPVTRKPSVSSILMRAAGALAALMSLAVSVPALAQATSRHCADGADSEERAGPACLLAHQRLGVLGVDSVYWSLDKYPSVEAARRDMVSGASVVKAFGGIWLFTVAPLPSNPAHGEHAGHVGPIPVDKKTAYDAEFLKSTFSPGMVAPIHVHSGPEAFFAVSGDSCLETPDGVQVGRGAGNSMIVRGGPPMLLMAPGPEPRKGFALILHDPALPPTTLVHDWTPKGLCRVAVP